MQVPDTETFVLPEKPYIYRGLSVQGVNPTRLTPYQNENITVPDEVGHAIARRLLARQLTESKTAIARVGLGLRPAARTVAAHVQAAIFFAELAQKVANSPSPESLTPTAVPRSEFGLQGAPGEDVGTSTGGVYFVDGEPDVETDVEVELG